MIRSVIPAVLFGALTTSSVCSAAAPRMASSQFPYGGPAFTRLIADSYKQANLTNPKSFYTWMDQEPQTVALGKAAGGARPGWTKMLAQRKAQVDAATSPAQKTQDELQDAAWLHKTIKAAIPHFSLQEGFEFVNAERKGERQCVLQATLMAGLLQAMDINAGPVMVYKNLTGQSTNNGHAATLVKLADGHDVLADCSEPTPFARHQGLFVADAANGKYRYVNPVFVGSTAIIASYKPEGETRIIPASRIKPMDYNFVRSQIEYYRGERNPGGLLDPHITAAGLAGEAQHLRRSIFECASNPLPEYMLGRVYLKQAKPAAASRQLTLASALYTKFGWLPQGCRDAMTECRLAEAKPKREAANTP